jgi:hypothetical protein
MDLSKYAAASSRFLKAQDISDEAGARKVLTISGVEIVPQKTQDGGEEEQVVLQFTELGGDAEDAKVLGLNKTNLRAVIEALGSTDSDDFIGKRISLFTTYVQNPQGKQVLAIRVEPKAPKAANAAKATGDSDTVTDDDIPF